MHKQLAGLSESAVLPEIGGVCRKCQGTKIKVVPLENEGKKFAVCEDCGDIRSIGSSLQERYSKWKSNREAPLK